ncbi:MAG: hypothetical protein KJ626_14360 [Verrucomicrobia bacterium]|nr:hypothetical protein [Verrucomicrobiota bacterium]
MQFVFMRRSVPRTGATAAMVAVCLGLAANTVVAGIQHTAEGFLFTGTSHSVLINDTNGSIKSITAGNGDIARSGAEGLWSLSYTNTALGIRGTVNAAIFSSTSPTDTFSWSLPAPSNSLYLTYSNVEYAISITISNRDDGIDMSAAVDTASNAVTQLVLPALLRFEPSVMKRFIAPNHSSDGVGMAYNTNYFLIQTEDDPASWKQTSVGPAGYVSLYGSSAVITNYDVVALNFTTDGVAWLGSDLSNKWASASATVHRPPASGQADVILLDSPHGAFFSGSHLGGGAGAGWLMRIGGLVDATRVEFSLDVVVAAIEHLAQTSGGRTNLAVLSMERGPVIGESWPSEVRIDQWLGRLHASTSLVANGIDILELTNVDEMTNALANTNVLAILNPYGELVPASLGGGVSATVAEVGNYIQSGGHWFEVAGYAFYQALQPNLYYTNNILYPPAFADFFQLETTNGNSSLYGVQPVPADPWSGSTNPATLFIPGRLEWGADATGGYFQRAFTPYVETNTTWQSPVVRLVLGETVENSLAAYSSANGFVRTLTNKMSASTLNTFKHSVLINSLGTATGLTERLSQLPSPSIIHLAQYLYGGFDKQYPDHLPPNATFGTSAEFTNLLAQAKDNDQMVMPYTNPTFWGEDPRGPTFTAKGEDPLLRDPDGSLSFEEYFGEGGYTVTPWHPDVQVANRHTRGLFITNYPVDIIFHDQIGARTGQYDMNTNSPAPHAYISGLAAIAAEDSEYMPVSTENGFDRLVNHEAQFCGLAWGLAPTTNAPFWRRYLRERYSTKAWTIFPLAQHIAHDKLSMVYNNLSGAVHNHEVAAWTLGLGYGMTYVVRDEEVESTPIRQWLYWIDRLQKTVCARYIGEPVYSFEHHWGTNAVDTDNGFIAAKYGTVEVTANLGPNPMSTNGWTLAPYGYIAESPDMLAACIIPPGKSDSLAYVVQTNSAGVEFWIYSVGDTNATMVLPAGFDGPVAVQLEGQPAAWTNVQSNVLTVSLGSSGTNSHLWHGRAAVRTTTPKHGPILIDFGADSSFRGTSVSNPDGKGSYWNSVWSGAFNANLIDRTNTATGINLGFDDAPGSDSFNGPTNAVDTNALGLIGGSYAAVNDYYVSSKFQIQGLDPGRTYDLTLFGSHKFSTDDATVYTIYSGTNYSTVITSATLNVQTPGSSELHNSNTVAVITNLLVHDDNKIYVGFKGSAGNEGYLNAMLIEARDIPFAYEKWALDYPGLGGRYADDDGDGLLNLGEFGFGGVPTNGLDTGYLPAIEIADSGGSSVVHYTYARRIDSGITYFLQSRTNLLAGSWTNAGYTELSATSAADPNFDAVSNLVPLTERKIYIRLGVQAQ